MDFDTTVGPPRYFSRHHKRLTSTVSPWDDTTTEIYPQDESTKGDLSVIYDEHVETIAEELGLPLWGKWAFFIVVCIVILGIGFFIIRRNCWKRHNAHSRGEVKPTPLLE